MEARPLLTSDVAKILDCSTDNVRVLERTGQLHAVKTPSGVRIYDPEEVDRLARARAWRLEARSARG
jgi:DNA-binding transcriptional MerR regulator